MSLAAYCVGSYRPGIRASDLFKVEVKPEYLEPLKFILNSRSHPWPTFVHNHKRTEEDVMVSIAINILVKLCTEVTMEKRYSTPLREPLLSFSDLGLGSPETWHGTPDARVRGTQVVHRMKSDIEDAAGEDSSDNESASSDRNTAPMEAKIKYKEANLYQAVSTCGCFFLHRKITPSWSKCMCTNYSY